MKVARKVQFKTNEICVGDQINVKLHGNRPEGNGQGDSLPVR